MTNGHYNDMMQQRLEQLQAAGTPQNTSVDYCSKERDTEGDYHLWYPDQS